MGRAKAFDRDEAVRTVMNEIWRNGYDASSVKALSEKLGITRSSFYNSFGTREDLFKEVMGLYSTETPDRTLNNIKEDGEVLREICLMFKAVCEVRARDPEHRGCLAINSLSELTGRHDELSSVVSDMVQFSLDRFERLLLQAEKRGELVLEDRAATALALQNLLIGTNMTSKVIHDSQPLWQAVRLTLEGLGVYKASFDL
ncbi:transcriptional regulator, TetR family [Pseudovibrio denitrificans]|uniref:Transcriptional regulator, TetR family n=1 Tax=Pseudovibrio denitrificans TaxID=258256 RepID=A0A1I7CK58_9HYPH|nr:TetR/AcrR family transcriptional regulator [Pseudovibrio denitrificans]SFT99802.1 transcriptional regulator, TetR family [Pseudovibrio denitrificans]